MPNAKSDLIIRHRKHLIKRILSRNPLLHFKPTTNTTRKVDVCELFEESQKSQNRVGNSSSDLLGESQSTTDDFFSDSLEESQNTAGDFFRNLIEDGTAELSFPGRASGMQGRMSKMQREASLIKRTTGEHSLFLAWPFVSIPRGGAVSLSSPLLFWEVEVEVKPQKIIVTIPEDISPRYNYMLEAWLKLQGYEADFSEFEQTNILNISSAIKIIKDICSKWPAECDNQITDNPYELCQYSASEKMSIMPCAVIGIAHFRYKALLRDLKDLADIIGSGDESTLMDEFLGSPSDDVLNPPSGKVPNEAKKYLVGQTDPSQEQVVWQARESKITLLDGPPGAGKSQTIVNLIVDSLERNENVMLVCHQTAALDVVGKRLKAVGMGDLTLSIKDPRAERAHVINEIETVRTSEGSKKHSNLREQYCNDMEKYEEQCETIMESLGGHCNYSIRGDLRGRIEEIRDRIKFSPSAPRTRDFVSKVNSLMENIVTDDYELKSAVEALSQLSDDYRGCHYSTNKWQTANSNPGYIYMKFRDLPDSARDLDEKLGDLPGKKLLPFLVSKLLRGTAWQFFSAEKRESVKKMEDLVKDTNEIFSSAGLDVNEPIWEQIYEGKGGDTYDKYVSDAAHLSTIVSINKMMRDNLIAAAFIQDGEKNGLLVENWVDILESIQCYRKHRILPGMRVQEIEKCLSRLKIAMQKKKESDAKFVIGKFNNRTKAAQNLANDMLLRVKGFGMTPATTLRKMYHDGMENVSAIFPALLTTPDAMAQVLPLEPGIIDMVIIDEASQMFVADALPVLYRAKKIVISGDKMQMPPDDLFALQNNEDEYQEPPDAAEEAPDVSSAGQYYELLDMVEKLISGDSSARCKLKVHYRSRPAELIAFSNHAFYEGRLQVAPDNYSPPAPFKKPIEVIPVVGTFAESVNEQEAEKIIEILNDIWSKENPPSVGVIVFNVKQAKHVKSKIEAKAEKSRTFGKAYQKSLEQEDKGEDVSFFIRSVEHVQGDERDIIILGTTYNNTGRYGTLSVKEKGQRRLNVAVTRAKLCMCVVTSMNIDTISDDGNRPGNDGSGSENWYLWKFMEYAESVSNGNQKQATNVLRSLNNRYDPDTKRRANPDSQFEIDVGKHILDCGYEVDYQVGEGGFRIDIGVKKKNGNGRYLCGIECDGRYWHEGWRARHNDIWRQEILEGKGWHIHRIWSDHWYEHPDETRQALKKCLEDLAKKAEQCH